MRGRAAFALLAALACLASARPAAAQVPIARPGVTEDPFHAPSSARRGPRGGVFGRVERWLSLGGYFRLRTESAHNLDLNRGPSPSTGASLAPTPLIDPESRDTTSSANMRLRLDPTLEIGREVRVHTRFDILDNLVLGSTPEGFPAATGISEVGGSVAQEPPQAGRNARVDSISAKRAWVELLLPIGLITAGRMGNRWGVGLVGAGDDDIDADADASVDRIGFATPLLGHVLGLAWDFNANGPTTSSETEPFAQAGDVDDADDVRTFSVALLRRRPGDALLRRARAGRWTIDYGLLASWRAQDADVPLHGSLGIAGDDRAWTGGEVVRRDLSATLVDGWLRVVGPSIRLEAEAALLRGRVGDSAPLPGVIGPTLRSRQLGLVARLEWSPADALGLRTEVGYASGDDAPGFGTGRATGTVKTQPGDVDGPQIDVERGDLRIDNFRFHPNYHVDQILWRRLIGTVTDARYVRAGARWAPVGWLELDASGIASWAVEAASAPGGAAPLGVELDFEVAALNQQGYELRAVYALLLPLGGLDNPALGLKADPAHLGRLSLLVPFH